MKSFIQKNWLRLIIYGGLVCCLADAFLIERHRIKINRLSLGPHPSLRVVQVSDFHYKGGQSYLLHVVETINKLAPDLVCFTGDIVENTQYLEEALAIITKLNAPVYGVPGNHEYWNGSSFERIGKAFRQTGGAWLVDSSIAAADGTVMISGRSGSELTAQRTASEFAMPGQSIEYSPVPIAHATSNTFRDDADDLNPGLTKNVNVKSTAKRILLTHYPAVVDSLHDDSYDLILAGHSHGGQIRLPLFGALIVPFGVNGYQMGLYQTPSGPLYVNAGVGTFLLPARFFCRPEITLIEL
ncbi:MAG: metallophosphoesterase [Lentisphaerota bacterium]